MCEMNTIYNFFCVFQLILVILQPIYGFIVPYGYETNCNYNMFNQYVPCMRMG